MPPADLEISLRFLKQQHVVPVQDEEHGLALIVSDPADPYPLQAVELAAGRPVALRVGLRSEIDGLIERYYGTGRSAMGTIVENLDGNAAEEDDVEHLRDLASEAPVIRLVNLILQRAVEQRASDVHIEPFENRLKVRYRVDGVLHEVEAPPSSSTAAVISRVKIMARLNIAERRLPQDGRIQLRVQGKELDLRVSTVPTSRHCIRSAARGDRTIRAGEIHRRAPDPAVEARQQRVQPHRLSRPPRDHGVPHHERPAAPPGDAARRCRRNREAGARRGHAHHV
jgi:general secretion pathway protein E